MNPLSIKQYFENDKVKLKFQELLGKKSTQFISSILQVTASNKLLSKADPTSVYQAASMAAILDLSINPNLGFAYILPYNQKQEDGSFKQVAQFQLGYRGFIQLAQRSGQFKNISYAIIYKGQVIEENPLSGYLFDFKKKESDEVIGYAAFFSLLNGFEKTLYMSKQDLEAHGKKFSQTYKKGYGLWKDDFDSMALKTVLKLLLSKFAPLSIEMQSAVVADQSVINDAETEDITYVDNDEVKQIAEPPELERLRALITESKTESELMDLLNDLTEYDPEKKLDALFKAKLSALSKKK